MLIVQISALKQTVIVLIVAAGSMTLCSVPWIKVVIKKDVVLPEALLTTPVVLMIIIALSLAVIQFRLTALTITPLQIGLVLALIKLVLALVREMVFRLRVIVLAIPPLPAFVLAPLLCQQALLSQQPLQHPNQIQQQNQIQLPLLPPLKYQKTATFFLEKQLVLAALSEMIAAMIVALITMLFVVKILMKISSVLEVTESVLKIIVNTDIAL